MRRPPASFIATHARGPAKHDYRTVIAELQNDQVQGDALLALETPRLGALADAKHQPGDRRVAARPSPSAAYQPL